MADDDFALPQARDQILESLHGIAEREGKVPTRAVEEAAQTLGCGKSTVWRWLAQGAPARAGRPAEFFIDQHVRDLLWRWRFNCAQVARELRREGTDVS